MLSYNSVYQNQFNHPSMRLPSIITLLLVATMLPLQAQNIQPTNPQDRASAIDHRQQMRAESVFAEYPVRNVGPVVMSGRVTDIAVQEDNKSHFFVAYASGGIFETTNSGNTMQPVFDHQGTITIGDIAISRADEDILWAGTGENNSSRSSYAGDGVYKSTDGGQSWNHVGLRGSQHIGRIRTHPTNTDVAWVASQGPLYHVNDMRGIYKTTDGGQSWNRTLTPPDSTGVIDLVMDPENPERMWATTWQRHRQAWNFKEAGEGSAIYMSTDGGESWEKSMEGFPEGDFVGRIGIDVSKSNPNILYAFLDNQKETKKKKETDEEQLTQADFVKMSEKEFLDLSNEELNSYLRSNGFPQKYNAQGVKNEVQEGLYEPKALADYLGDANAALFETSIEGAQVYRSKDGGKSWKKINSYALDNLIYTYGYYFGEVRVSPSDPDVLYITGVPALKSTDGGKTWAPFAENQPVHVDHHALWLDPQDSEHLLLGNDGGLYESQDGGENFIHHNNVPVGQFYSVAVDMEKPYNIYGGLQDNGVFMGSSQGSPNDGNEWERIFGGDGMHVAIDPRDSDLIYTGFQFGNYFRIQQSPQKITRITPQNEIGKETYRYNWNTPLEMSNHTPEVLYMGSQKVSRSFDRGENWTPISPDLTDKKTGQQEGNVPYSTMTTISESPLNFNVIWAGTDDENIQLTRNGGESWELVSENLPQRRWVSQVHASNHEEGTAYASLNGYRYDEFKTYLYKTTDYGQSWTSVKGNLPESVANVLIQDPKNPNMLYAGLDMGTFVSFDDGSNWHLLNGVPNVPSYDMTVHPRDLELVVGTHGRSIYVADLKPLHTIADQRDEPITALEPEPVRFSESWGEQSVQYRPANEPKVTWMYWVGDESTDNETAQITVTNSDDETVATLDDEASYGFNTVDWNLKRTDEDGYLSKGTYTITYNLNGNSDETTFEITGNNRSDNSNQRVFGSPDEIQYEEHEEY
jgi:photosystem II stability/assembly factor-like uncharacterized protein